MSAPTDPGHRGPSRRATTQPRTRLGTWLARWRARLAEAPRRVAVIAVVALVAVVAAGSATYALVGVPGTRDAVLATDPGAVLTPAPEQTTGPDEALDEALDEAAAGVPANPGGARREVREAGPAIRRAPAEPTSGAQGSLARAAERAAGRAEQQTRGRRAERCVPGPDTQLRVATYNIKGADSRYGGSNLGAVIADIRSWDVDVAILQEVYRLGGDPARADQPAQIAGALGMDWAFGYNVRKGPRTQYGTAVVSRFPIVEQANVRLPNAAGGEQRGLLRATVDLGTQQVDVFDTHLQHQPQYDGLRVAQARVVAQQIGARRAATGNPAVLGGDFNSSPTGSVSGALQSVLSDTWFAVGAGAGATHPAGSPNARIDRLYQSEDVVPLGAAVRPSAGSDHNAVTALYEIAGTADCG